MTNDQSNPNTINSKSRFDLEERTVKFSKEIIDFCKDIPKSPLNNPLVSQLVRAATSIGANYCEADEASSKKDFSNKIAIANKEAKETKYWVRIVVHSIPELAGQARRLWQEAHELNLIFSAIIRKIRGIGY